MIRRKLSVWLALLLAGAPVCGWGAAAARVPVVTLSALGHAALPVPSPVFALLPAAPLAAVPSVLVPAALAVVPAPRPAVQEPPPAAAEAATYEAGRAFDLSGKAAPDAVAAEGPASPAGLAGITRRGEGLSHEGRRLELLGAGSFGRVFAHPRERGAVIKLISHDLGAILAVGGDELGSARLDLETGRRLAEAGVGPRVYGLTSIPGEPSTLHRLLWRLFGRTARAADRPAVVKERVHGANVEDLIAAKRFTERDRALVHEMLGRMADARLRVSDLRASNVMIGRTGSDPAPRAYLIDGGRLLAVAPAQTRPSLFESLLRQRTVVLDIGGGGTGGWAGGGERALDPFDDILRAGAARK